MITVQNFVEDFKNKKIHNTKTDNTVVSTYIKNMIEIKTYIPFRQKREIAEMVVSKNTIEADGIKKNDAINQYISFVVAMLTAHTSLEFSENPVNDYDLLSESGLLPQIIEEFKSSYDECDIILKMAVAAELEDNNINALVGKFLNGILNRLDSFGMELKDKFKDLDIKETLGEILNKEDLAKLNGFLNKYNK